MDQIIETQRREYEESLRNDIENEIVVEEQRQEQLDCLRIEIETQLIEDARTKDEEAQRLSPKSMRLQRILYFEKKMAEEAAELGRCTHYTKAGNRCKLKLFKDSACHIHVRIGSSKSNSRMISSKFSMSTNGESV